VGDGNFYLGGVLEMNTWPGGKRHAMHQSQITRNGIENIIQGQGSFAVYVINQQCDAKKMLFLMTMVIISAKNVMRQ
jgi:hypothetical protein